MPRETTKVMVALKLQVDLLTGIRLLAASAGRGGPASHHLGSELGQPPQSPVAFLRDLRSD